MKRRLTSVVTPIAHLIGPGQVKVINQRLAFNAHDAKPVRLDPAALTCVLCYGSVGITDEALRVLLANDIAVAFLTPAGNRCRGRLVGGNSATALTRLAQIAALADPHRTLEYARLFVRGKIQSQLAATRHYQRHSVKPAGQVRRRLSHALRQTENAASLDVLRGIEGAATASWFELFGALLRAPWRFPGRVRRPPTDPINALLSLGYTCLLTRAVARCEAAGLEVALGALHSFHPGRPSLACDLIESLRIPAVDRWVCETCNNSRIRPAEFESSERGTRLTPGAFPRILNSWETHWRKYSMQTALDTAVDEFVRNIRRTMKDGPPP